MKRLNLHMLTFNTLDFVRTALELFDTQKPEYPIAQKLLVDQHWPLTEDPKKHSLALEALAEKHGWRYVKPLRNRGVGGSWDWVVRELELGDNDVLWGTDPDEAPQSAGYLDAAMRVFNSASECYTVQLNQNLGEYLTYPRDEIAIGGEPVLRFHQDIAWSAGGFSVSWLKRIGGFLQSHPIYGHCETAISAAARPMGGRFYILKNHFNQHIELQEPLYKKWKLESAMFQTRADFATWLKDRR